MKLTFLIFLILTKSLIFAQKSEITNLSKVWVSDNGDGTYKNPIIYADYSDPDVVRVGGCFYMTASSFNCVPGLPVLQSYDLVNWTIIGHAINQQKPLNIYNKPQHGNGVWAPCIRFHKNEFYIYYGDPDFGIYLVKARNASGPWTEPVLVKEAKGWIDPCPFWDDNDSVYLVHAWAGSRAGIKSILTMNRMNSEGTKVTDAGSIIFDGHKNQPTIEGPKIYKRNGYFYILAPAGGVKMGWQLALRSKSIYGPYEEKIVMHQGNTPINGPHQGGWVETQTGESWFIHFQDLEAYGRVVHLQPMNWINDWPAIGVDSNNDGIGEPVLKNKKPEVGKVYPMVSPQTNDEFNSSALGLQWQWHANPNPNWGFPSTKGFFRLTATPLPDSSFNFWDVPNLLLQKFMAPEFTATAKIIFNVHDNGEKTGLLIMGTDYSYISVQQQNGTLKVNQVACLNADKKNQENEIEKKQIKSNQIYLRVKVSNGGICNFFYSENGGEFIPLGKRFIAKPGRWIGAKVGLFCESNRKIENPGYADIDWFRIE